jgi:hypothetical protein
MGKSISVIQKIAWVYAVMFLVTVLVSHIPSFTDQKGLLFGLYHVSPLIDSVHFLSGVLAVVVALHSTRWSVTYFKWAGVIFGIDVLLSLLFSRDLLETFSIFTRGIGSPNFSVTNLLANSPHTLISLFALWVGFRFSKQIMQK